MARCAACNGWIFRGTIRYGDSFVCNQKCYDQAARNAMVQHVPADLVDSYVEGIFNGPCPRCNRQGGINLHRSHRIYSMLLLTRWQTLRHVCCPRCAKIEQSKSLALCLLLGWWGFPWGIGLTPLQVIKNIVALARKSNNAPTAEFRSLILGSIASQMARRATPLTCQQCGYDLRVQQSLGIQRCPECGTSVPGIQARPAGWNL